MTESLKIGPFIEQSALPMNDRPISSLVLLSGSGQIFLMVMFIASLVNSESLDFPCYCAAQLAELTEYFFTKICAVMGEGGHLQQRG